MILEDILKFAKVAMLETNSPKIAESRGRVALEPHRSTGKRRVAELMRAGVINSLQLRDAMVSDERRTTWRSCCCKT
jgi:hypothetical protein